MVERFVLQRFGLCLLLIPILTGLFWVLMTVVMALPDKPIREHILEDAALLDVEYQSAFNGRKIDLFTECIGVTAGMAPLLRDEPRAVTVPVWPGCGPMQIGLAGNEAPTQVYHRYWHGYAVPGRVLLSLLPYADLRAVVFLVTAGLMIWLAVRLSRIAGAGFAAAFFLPFLFVNFAGPLMLLTKAVAWWVLLGFSIWLAGKKRDQSRLPLMGFFLCGALTAYTDLLTTPALNAAIPAMVWWVAARNKTAQPLRALFWLLSFFALGYVGLWAAKFTLAAATLGPSVWANIGEATSLRLRGGDSSPLPLAAMLKNIVALKALWGPLTVIIFGVLPFVTKERRARAIVLWREGRIFLLTALTPILFMEILSAHAQVHGIFTHVNLLPVLIVSSLILFDQQTMVTRSPHS
ncbi:MAG: hypothetical protein ABR512_15195 [Desulfopila sp.]